MNCLNRRIPNINTKNEINRNFAELQSTSVLIGIVNVSFILRTEYKTCSGNSAMPQCLHPARPDLA